MHALSFLTALPAVLGIVGFFAYIWAGQSRIGGDISKRIVDKLRTNPNLDPSTYNEQSPQRIAKLIRQDAKIRSAINEQDTKLLQTIIVVQHIVTAMVVVISAVLIGWSIWLISRPQALSVIMNPPKAFASAAHGELVDLDPLLVDWSSTGPDERMQVFLENVDSHARSAKHSIDSNVRSAKFEQGEVFAVATSREYRGSNRIRSVAEWPGGRSTSESIDLAVGIEVELALYGKLINDEPERVIHTLIATIDSSTAGLPSGYCFSGSLTCYMSDHPAVIPLKSCNADTEVKIPGIERVQWERPSGFAYYGPDDPTLVRTRVSGQPR